VQKNDSAPYAEAVRAHADRDWLRLNVPGHGADRRPTAVTALLGREVLALDFPPLLEGIDLGPAATPLDRARSLAAEAWGARRTWFLTDGASEGNRIATCALASLGGSVVVQRSVHSSVVDGLVLSGLAAGFVHPSIDTEMGIAHGVTAEDLAKALRANPDAVAALVVSPSYFGAAADIRALAEVAHAAGVPLVVDEAWGAHFGFHPDLPANALAQGADLVVSSTHKLAGSLTQSAMLHLGHGRFADVLEPLIDRAFRLFQSTSGSALLLASLDAARHDLVHGTDAIGDSIRSAEIIRQALREAGRFRVVSDTFSEFGDIAAADPLRVSIDTQVGGISGHEARRRLMTEHGVFVEVATASAIVAVIGAGVVPAAGRFLDALHALPDLGATSSDPTTPRLPEPGPVALSPREAFLRPADLFPAAHAVGRISADTLAAYPPGIPNLIPGELITAETVNFLQQVAASPTGHVRGAADPAVSTLRVVAD
jgi:lysine decarboxylase